MAQVTAIANRLGAYRNSSRDAEKALSMRLLQLTRENGERLVRSERESGANIKIYRCGESREIQEQRLAQKMLKNTKEYGELLDALLKDSGETSRRNLAYTLAKEELERNPLPRCPRMLKINVKGGDWIPSEDSENCSHLMRCMDYTLTRRSDLEAAIGGVAGGSDANPNRTKRAPLQVLREIVSNHSEGMPALATISRFMSAQRLQQQEERDRLDWDLLIPMCEALVERNPGSMCALRTHLHGLTRIRLYYSTEDGQQLKLSPISYNPCSIQDLEEDEEWQTHP
jgi:hypothetical protein